MAIRNKNNTGITLAVVGGGALLLWLLWRGRGKGKAKGSGGDRSSSPAAVEVWILPGDRLALDRVDGVRVDLATVIARARAAGAANTHSPGDARYGWVEKVNDTLRSAGVKVQQFLPKTYSASDAA